jgi:hypothetical protein
MKTRSVPVCCLILASLFLPAEERFPDGWANSWFGANKPHLHFTGPKGRLPFAPFNAPAPLPGGAFGFFANSTKEASDCLALIYFFSKGGNYLAAELVVPGWGTTDAKAMGVLILDVRGESGLETMKVALASKGDDGKEAQTAPIPLDGFLPSGKLTKDWQRAIVSIAKFQDLAQVKLEKLSKIKLYPAGPEEGEYKIFVDNVALVKDVDALKAAPAPAKPVITVGNGVKPGDILIGVNTRGPKTWFVAADGTDRNDGLSQKSPLKSAQIAADQSEPGDTIYFLNGHFDHKVRGYTAFLTITRSGSPGKPIRYLAYPGHKPKITFECYQAIVVKGASWIEISGLEIEGFRAKTTLTYATEKKDENLGELDGSAITIQPMGSHHKPLAPYPTHVVVRSNHVHDCTAAGIGAHGADYILIEGNRVYSCSWYSPWATSGIGVGWGFNSDTNHHLAKHVLRSNISYDNDNKVIWRGVGKLTDGNGIIVDTHDNRDRAGWEPYHGRTLVEGNLCFNNGGSGAHAYQSSHVDLVGNTAFWNYRRPGDKGADVFAAEGSDNYVVANTVYALFPKRIANNNFVTKRNQRVASDFNIWGNATSVDLLGPNDVVADPLFTRLSSNESGLDLTPKAGSPIPARNAKFPGLEAWKRDILPGILASQKRVVFKVPEKSEPIPYAPGIRVDGDLSDWLAVAPMALPFSAYNFFMKAGESQFKFAWDEKGLYGSLTTTDGDIKANPAAPYEGDCLELWIENDFARAESGMLSPNALQIWLTPQTASGKAGASINYHKSKKEFAATILVSSQARPGGYQMEFFIPAKILSPAKMEAGARLGFNFARINDGKAVEQFYCDKQAEGAWNCPAMWGAVVLTR